MAVSSTPAIKEILSFIEKLFKENLPDWAYYHNFDHTLETYEACIEIGENSELNNSEMQVLMISALFHDTGYLYLADGHEEKSTELATDYLEKQSFKKKDIELITDVILATKLGRNPKNILESIIKDADLITLGKKNFFLKNDLLKKEFESRENKVIDDISWLKRSYLFLESHKFYSEYARGKYSKVQSSNLRKLKRILGNANIQFVSL